MCTKDAVEPVLQAVAAPVAAQVATNIELVLPVQTARAVESTRDVSAAGVAREIRNSKYSQISTQEV